MEQLKRLERLTSILIQLQSKRVIKAKEIADRFRISLRTVYRDIRALELAGVPINSEAGYGYSIISGFNLPPVMFTEEEARALIIGQKITERFSDLSIKQNFQSALFKIQAILKNNKRDKLEILEQQTKVFQRNAPINDTANLAVIQKAISEKRKIKISYLSNYKNEKTERIVSPIGIAFYTSNWHIIGWCELRNDYRDFNTQRIKNLIITDQRYFPSKLKTLDIYLKEQNQNTKLWDITININKKAYPFMVTQKYYFGFLSDREKEQSYEVNFLCPDLDYFCKSMLMYGNEVTIVKPKEVKLKILKLINELNVHYRQKP